MAQQIEISLRIARESCLIQERLDTASQALYFGQAQPMDLGRRQLHARLLSDEVGIPRLAERQTRPVSLLGRERQILVFQEVMQAAVGGQNLDFDGGCEALR